MPNGDGGGFDFGGLFGALIGELAALIAAILQFLHDLVQALVQVLNFLFQGELSIFDFSFKSLNDIYRGVKNVLDQVFKISIVAALKHLLSLYQKLARWVAKLKTWLDRLRRIQQLYQVQAMKRFINLIQRIRQVLVIFRLLHLKFASKLDAWLAGIEGKLITRVADYGRKTNEIIGWLNVIADPLQAYKKGLIFGTYGRMGRGLFNALSKTDIVALFPILKQSPKGTR